MKTELNWQQVRWSCDPKLLKFKTTKDVTPINRIIGQDDAVDALRFAIESNAYGQNVYVRGLTGTGRMTMVSRILADIKPQLENKHEYCYVANFSQPDRPKLLTFYNGEGKLFCQKMEKLANYIEEDLKRVLESESVQLKKASIEEATQKKIRQLSQPFESEIKKHNLALLNINTNSGQHTIVVPLHEGKPVDPQQWKELIANKIIDEKAQETLMESQQHYSKKLDELSRKINELRESAIDSIQQLLEEKTRVVIKKQVSEISKSFKNPGLDSYLDDVIEDVVEQFFDVRNKEYAPASRYAVNLLLHCQPGNESPVIIERNPSLYNLLGTIETKWQANGPGIADHMSIKPGTLLRANGGYLILDARDMLTEPGAWKVLIRTLKNQLLEIVPAEISWPFSQVSLKPEPIPVDIRVILLGDSNLYYLLDNQDPDFPELFKVLSDFDSVIDRNQEGFNNYAGIISRLAKQENLLPFTAGAVAKLIEHGARICSRKDKLTAKFSRVADLAREGHFLAVNNNQNFIEAEDITQAIIRTKRRAGLPARKFQEMLSNGTINVDTDHEVIGQINGLAVIHAGPIVYGFPSRITTTIGPGRAGVIDIEGQSAMSGSIHTKGFHILGGLLRYLLSLKHPLTFSASIAFEQSYGGIDGDSASGAEFCCLMSALTEIPIKQSFSMTGAIDQHGRVQAIGGVNEKIEGFFDVCNNRGLSGDQGVIIPQANAGELMLRSDVQQACKEGLFHIHAVENISQALETLMGVPVGVQVKGVYAENTILHKAVQMAGEYWRQTQASAQ